MKGGNAGTVGKARCLGQGDSTTSCLPDLGTHLQPQQVGSQRNTPEGKQRIKCFSHCLTIQSGTQIPSTNASSETLCHLVRLSPSFLSFGVNFIFWSLEAGSCLSTCLRTNHSIRVCIARTICVQQATDSFLLSALPNQHTLHLGRAPRSQSMKAMLMPH